MSYRSGAPKRIRENKGECRKSRTILEIKARLLSFFVHHDPFIFGVFVEEEEPMTYGTTQNKFSVFCHPGRSDARYTGSEARYIGFKQALLGPLETSDRLLEALSQAVRQALRQAINQEDFHITYS